LEARHSVRGFPAGLSTVAGDFNFDATRMMFENVTCGKWWRPPEHRRHRRLWEGPLNYTLNVRSDQIRIRYPPEWLAVEWCTAPVRQFTGGDAVRRIVVDRC